MFMDVGDVFVDVVYKMFVKLDGVFVLVFFFEGEEDFIVVVCKGLFFVIGYGNGEMFVGFDVVVFVFLIDEIIYFEEGDSVVFICIFLEICNVDGVFVNCVKKKIVIDLVQVDKGGYKYFMVKEIVE